MRYLISALVTIFVPIFSLSAETITGSAVLQDKTSTETVSILGSLEGENLNMQRLVVNGPATLKNSIIQEATIHGPLASENVNFKGTVAVNGVINASKSSFNKLLVSGDRVMINFNDTSADEVQIAVTPRETFTIKIISGKKIVESKKEEQTEILLNGASRIKSLIFKEGTGTVFVAPTATLETVTGAEVIKMTEDELRKKEQERE